LKLLRWLFPLLVGLNRRARRAACTREPGNIQSAQRRGFGPQGVLVESRKRHLFGALQGRSVAQEEASGERGEGFIP